MSFIHQMEPWIGEEEKQAMSEYLDSGAWLTEFKKSREFEEMICDYCGAKYCSLMPNGTLSLAVALVACGIQRGDDVLVPDYTMVATPNSVVQAGARPVFVDVEEDSLCIDFDDLKHRITRKTKALMLVSINGRVPTKMKTILDFCAKNNILVIEDAAQSLGSFYDTRHLGTFGAIGSFSFSALKVITTGQGGALVTDDKELYEKIKKIRDFGRSAGGIDHYLTMGWNMKFTDLQAVIGIEQMKKLPWRVERKKKIYQLYKKKLSRIKNVVFVPTSSETSPWSIDVLIDKREGLITYLSENNVGSRPFYPPLHSEPVYGFSDSFPITEKISRKGLWLPSSSKLSDDEINEICGKIEAFYE